MSGEISLRRAQPTDSEFLFRLRTDPETVRQSRGASPTRSEHIAWMAESLRSDSRRLFIAEHIGRAIGTGRLDRRQSRVELSWTIAPEYRGKGLSLPLILALQREAREIWPGAKLIAVIRSSNTPSLRAALAAGMRCRGSELLDLEAP